MAISTPLSVRPRVVVIGAGFGGIYAAKHLGKLPSTSQSSIVRTTTPFSRCSIR
jgi:NADH dehydrogenase FAD-containing subunit